MIWFTRYRVVVLPAEDEMLAQVLPRR